MKPIKTDKQFDAHVRSKMADLPKKEQAARLKALKDELFNVENVYIHDCANDLCYRLKPTFVMKSVLKEILTEAYEEYYACTRGETRINLSPYPKTRRLEELLGKAEKVEFDPTRAYILVVTSW